MTSTIFTTLASLSRGPNIRDLLSSIRHVKQQHGVGICRQIKEILQLRFGKAQTGASEYFYYSLYDPTLSVSEKESYIGWRRWTRLEQSLVRPEWWILFEDKLIFQALADAYNIPQPTTMAILRNGTFASPNHIVRTAEELAKFFCACLKDFPIFCKPVSTGRGVGIVRIDEFDPDNDLVITSEGKQLSVDKFFDDTEEYRKRGYIFQKVVKQHRDLSALVGDALATFRFVVAIDNNSVIINQVVWKIPLAGNIVDNFSHGNMIAGICIDDGKITRVVCSPGPKVKEVKNHPDTNVPLVGQTIPYWNDLKAFVISASGFFPEIKLQGWDIALSAEGPLVIEANVAGDETLPQLANRCGALSGNAKYLLNSCL